MNLETARFIFDHVFLPPNLPQADHAEVGGDELLKQISQAANEFGRSFPSGNEARVWAHLSRSLSKWIDLFDGGTPCSYKIINNLRSMRENDVLLFYVKPQNAAILVRNRSTGAIFECFEVLPKTDAVLAAKDALLRQFPARAVFVTRDKLNDTSFIHELGTAIHKLSVEPLRLAMETTKKARNNVSEERQSAHPRAVTEWLFGLLSSMGKATASPIITKRTHDDVCWKDANLPWRRSGLWLCARVAIQVALFNSDLVVEDHSHYKNFMLFLLSRLATEISMTDMLPDVLHVLRVKLARRNAKLGVATFGFVQTAVREALHHIDETMRSLWKEVTERDNISIPRVPVREVTDKLALKHSHAALQNIWQRAQKRFTYSQAIFIPPSFPRIPLLRDQLPRPQIFEQRADLLFNLVDFELWVEENLETWLQSHTTSSSSCSPLVELIQTYHAKAESKYDGHPERMSVMFLTMFELWVALDTIATTIHPLLLNYPPDIPANLFEPLLLHKQAELERLSRIESHIAHRNSSCKDGCPSLFSDPSYNCFAIKFYDVCPDMKELRNTIEKQAKCARTAKTNEWNSKKVEFDGLMRKVESMEHGVFIPRNGRYAGRPRHDKFCARCAKEKKANALEIEKHEWPLPESETLCKAVIFELLAPEAITCWRDATFYLIHDIDRTETTGQASKQVLLSFPPLQKHALNKTRRITLASSIKPMSKAHYFKTLLGIDDIFVKNGLEPRMYDTAKSGVWTAKQTAKPSLVRRCASQLPPSLNRHLTRQVHSTQHSQNSVIAKQSQCPPEMGPHEYLVFGSLRSGERLQWFNVLASLMSTEIDLNSAATALLFLHAISQVGTPGSIAPSYLRESQVELMNEAFCRSLLDALEGNFARVEANWKEATAVSVLLTVTLKVVSISPYHPVVERCMKLISRIRSSACIWIRQLVDLHAEQRDRLVDDLADGAALKDLSRHILNACLLARRTYALDSSKQKLLFSAHDAGTDYVEASLHLHTHRESYSSTGDSKLETDLLNDEHLARRCEKHFQVVLKSDDAVITEGIRRFWPAASFTGRWQTVHANDTSWVQNHVSSKCVHYNLITGSLLVSGRALARLPSKYSSHPLYRAIFGDPGLEVFPSDVDDMEYMSKNLFAGHKIYFGMRNEGLLIRSRIENDTFEAVLPDQFLGDLPTEIVKYTIPWMSLNDGRVFFRPNERPWISEAGDWILYPDINSKTTHSMRTDHAYLIDSESAVGSTICQIFRPFEQPDHIVMAFSQDTIINISLPRYQLNFYVDYAGNVVCKELSAVIDTSQAIGTLYGLKSRLVLHVEGESEQSSRILLIPNGPVSISSARPHITAHVVLKEEDDSLSFSQYRLDSRLGRLASETQLEAFLFKTYLHAITSFPEPDAFTGRTGTEESLFNLSDPVCRTSIPLSARSQSLLTVIGELSPERLYYPAHLRTMQTDTFHDVLPILSQRDLFFGTVHEIVAHNIKSVFLFENADITAPKYAGDFGLLERSHHRSRKLYPCESVATMRTVSDDHEYPARDRDRSHNQTTASTLAGLVESWPSTFGVCSNLKDMIQCWQEISGFEENFTVISYSRLLSEENFKDDFPRLLSLCRSGTFSKQELSFILSLIAFGNPDLVPKLRSLLAFAVSPSLRALPAPQHNHYDLCQGHSLNERDILAILSHCEEEFVPKTDSNSEDTGDEFWQAEWRQFQRELQDQRELILNAVRSSWPGDTVRLPAEHLLGHYQFSQLKLLLNGRFAAWHKNHVFLNQFYDFDQALRAFHVSWTGPKTLDTILDSTPVARAPVQETHFSLLDLMNLVDVNEQEFNQSKPSLLDEDLSRSVSGRIPQNLLNVNELRCTCEELEGIIEDLDEDTSSGAHHYAKFLNDSLVALQEKAGEDQAVMKVPPNSVLSRKVSDVKDHIAYILRRVRQLLEPRLECEKALVTARIWPQVSQLTLLQLLSADHRGKLPRRWVDILIRFAKEISALQRVGRIQKYLVANDSFALQRELANPAHAAWSPRSWPDWLLLEIQNNILIRPAQVRVAKELIKPENGVVLLGMGEGKTSVILPMVITALAHGTHLVRVVVLKPLANEMLRLLSRSLSGLVGRTVYHLPFSRQTYLGPKTPQLLMNLFQECRQTAGVLLTLPEHLNSFRLIGRDKLAAPDTFSLATELIGVQKWLDCNARDILDESDELLKPAYELVYTNGEANLLSGAPDRWTIALELLGLIQKNAAALHSKSPTGIEFEPRLHGSFPHVRILHDEGGHSVAKFLAQEVVERRVSGLPLGHCNSEVLASISSFILDVDVDESKFRMMEEHFKGSAQLDILYVVRGLIAYQTLNHCLRKRWLVTYGLDRSRSLSAVPYRAKSTPSPSAEFAHPETAIILTALSFYYTGLSRSDIRRCILILMKSPDPMEEYSKWVSHSTLTKFRTASAINLEDASCIDVLHEHLRMNSEVINFFLRFVVYPSEAKEFRYKLSSSAWDLCSNDGGKVTSGFSGTCDSRIPKFCTQKDLPDLRYITASTLSTLLRHDNRTYLCAASSTGQRLSTKELLKLVVKDDEKHNTLDVIIDVGAQMLEDNKEIASKWLALSQNTGKTAAIFFSDNDEKMVLKRDGAIEPLVTSTFKDKIGDCLIYLDEFHTRGTDFQLPDKFKAAVLLGPGLLKDNLAQACMRMRKLQVSQSVKFFAPPEVDQNIRSILKGAPETLDSSHVLRWALHQSCTALKSQGPLWITRGLLHSRRRLASARHVREGQIVDAEEYLNTIRERESRPVSEMYRADRRPRKQLPFEPKFEEEVDVIMKDLLVQFERTDISDFKDTGIDEEQEREILHEVEQEREIQRPKEVRPAVPKACISLLNLIKDGTFPEGSPELCPAFEVLLQTRLACHYGRLDFPMHVLVTRDFLRTIENRDKSPEDDFLRPVQWVLKAKRIKQPIIISPHEAQVFLPVIRLTGRATLILYQPRVSRSMTPFDSMNVYKVPESAHPVDITPQEKTTLNLFAGQLYFSSFVDYQRLCELIGLWDGVRPLPIQREVANDNFVSPACRMANGWTECTFTTSPVSMLKAFIGMRRLGIEWSHTHMGRILAGRILRKEEFENNAA
ncbi:uncharacterized protein Z518_00747 [Rhinocladiella mackenziei CBS 650.93]|uniref:ubiquitinyl hydrolase 1 n=1 Tax=Rhinocladiella mackenziei CBS 650.93 TaxID=1442369 RepID=A0A0D2J1U4_9EURO|nr:uncharacterized protein Z518_00747 [Rhinocladiella mackenziei CBS 650.93]KIX09666.1 hypothetical protein Z518_00747 [Rhinocladiella mackenziei CBS 650.93]